MLFTTALDFEVVHSIFTNLGSKHLPVRSAIRVVWLMPKSLEVTCQRNPISCLEITPKCKQFVSQLHVHTSCSIGCLYKYGCLLTMDSETTRPSCIHIGDWHASNKKTEGKRRKQRALNKLCSIVQPSISLNQNFSC
jgi:hypothetical protein